ATADETFVPVAKVELPTKENFKDWKAGLVKQLREKVFRALPEKVPAATHNAKAHKLDEIETEPGIVCQALIVKLVPRFDTTGTFAVLNPDEDVRAARTLWEERYPDGGELRGLYPRNGGSRKWAEKNPPNTVARSLVLLGQTVDSGRLRDVAAALNAHKGKV